MIYNIKGHQIDMSPVESAIQSGEILDVHASLSQVFRAITDVDTSRWSTALTQHIIRVGSLPSEQEVLSIIADADHGIITARGPIHSQFPMPEKPTAICPTCHSTRLTKLSAGSRFIDRMFFGVFSPESRAQFRCMDCGYLF